MPRYKLEWSVFALQSLNEIHYYIASREKSNTPADKFIQKIFEKTDLLVFNPFIGQSESALEEIGQTSRYLVEGSYKIIYQIEDKVVTITDIFHTKQDPRKIVKRAKGEND
jgi:plasmid stabilization system protein ParE